MQNTGSASQQDRKLFDRMALGHCAARMVVELNVERRKTLYSTWLAGRMLVDAPPSMQTSTAACAAHFLPPPNRDEHCFRVSSCLHFAMWAPPAGREGFAYTWFGLPL